MTLYGNNMQTGIATKDVSWSLSLNQSLGRTYLNGVKIIGLRTLARSYENLIPEYLDSCEFSFCIKVSERLMTIQRDVLYCRNLLIWIWPYSEWVC